MPSLSWTFAFAWSMVSLAFDIERCCLASQRLDEDLHATTQCVLLGLGGDGLCRLREGLRSCLRASPTPSASYVRNTFRLLARSSQLLCTPGLGATRQLQLDQLLCMLRLKLHGPLLSVRAQSEDAIWKGVQRLRWCTQPWQLRAR